MFLEWPLKTLCKNATQKHYLFLIFIQLKIKAIGLLKPFIDTKKLVMIQETYSGTSKRIGSNRIAYKCPMVKSFEAFIYCICIGNDIGARDDVFESDTDYMTEFCNFIEQAFR